MTELQSRLLEMLKWYHSFCVEHDLRYYAIGGTTLGAVRHDGFIPWDDDVDVGMPRPDYERFQLLASREINGKTPFLVEFPLEKRDFVYPYAKLYDTRTTLIEPNRYKTKRGIFLDIFPLDGMRSGGEKRKARKLIFLNGIFAARVCMINRRRKLYKNLFIALFRCIPDCILPPEKIIRAIIVEAIADTYDESNLVGNIVGMVSPSLFCAKSIYGKPVLHKFEDTEIYIQERSEEYLRRCYGDWRTLPPEEKRVSEHEFTEIDLNHSFVEKDNSK